MRSIFLENRFRGPRKTHHNRESGLNNYNEAPQKITCC